MKYAGIINDDIVNGKGICISFWVSGCPHHCPGCHNPETWNKNYGYDLPDDYIQRIEKLLTKNGIRRNLSILGGEPLCLDNIAMVYDLLLYVKNDLPATKVFVWTGGKYEDLLEWFPMVFKYIDVLVDGEFDITKRDITLPLRGSPNQRIIDVQASLKTGKVITIPDSKFKE